MLRVKENAIRLASEQRIRHAVPIVEFIPLMDLACLVAEFQDECSLFFSFEEEFLKYVYQGKDKAIKQLLACDDVFIEQYTSRLVACSRTWYNNDDKTPAMYLLSRIFIILDHQCNRPHCYYNPPCTCTKPLTGKCIRNNSIQYKIS